MQQDLMDQFALDGLIRPEGIRKSAEAGQPAPVQGGPR